VFFGCWVFVLLFCEGVFARRRGVVCFVCVLVSVTLGCFVFLVCWSFSFASALVHRSPPPHPKPTHHNPPPQPHSAPAPLTPRVPTHPTLNPKQTRPTRTHTHRHCLNVSCFLAWSAGCEVVPTTTTNPTTFLLVRGSCCDPPDQHLFYCLLCVC